MAATKNEVKNMEKTQCQDVGQEKQKVTAWLRFSRQVSYEIEVSDPTNLEEIKQALREKDASDWEHDPEFYESWGFDYRRAVEELKQEDINIEGGEEERKTSKS